MRARHTPHALPTFPVYSAAFLSSSELVLGGGGGASKTGIKNKLRLYNVVDHKSLELVDELELESGEDAPMSMAAHPETKQFVCGVNSVLEKLKSGENENCRVYSVNGSKLTLVDTRGTLTTGDEEDYQKVTALSSNGTLLAIGGNRDLSLLTYPALLPAAEPIHVDRHDIYDAFFSLSSSQLILTTTANLFVYALPKLTASPPSKKTRKGKQKEMAVSELEQLRTIEVPALSGDGGATFRAARNHPTNDNFFYTIVNTSTPRSRKTKSVQKQGWVCKWSAETWQVVNKRKIGDKGLACFDVSPDGRFLAYGTSEYTVGILDANTLSPLLTILKAHDFPITTLRFNPTSKLLVSGSADHSIRVISIPDSLGGQSWGMFILIALLIVLFAIFLGSQGFR